MLNRLTSTSFIIFLLLYFLMVIGIGCFFTRANAEVLDIMADINRSGLQSAIERLLLNYDGRYFTNILHGLNPVAYGYLEYYQLMPILGILLFFGSIYFWISTFFVDVPVKQKLFLVSITVFFHFAFTPDITSELFNLIASYVYLYGICFWVIWTASAFRFYHAQKPAEKLLWFLFAAFGIIASTGTNEQLIVLNGITVLGLLFFNKSIARGHELIPFILIVVICSLFFVSCPGWRYRVLIEQHIHNQSAQGIFFNGFVSYFQNVWSFLFPLFILFPVSLLGSISINSSNKLFKWLTFKDVIILYVLIFLAGFVGAFIYLAGVQNNDSPPGRIYCVTFSLLQLSVLLLFPHIAHKLKVILAKRPLGLLLVLFLFVCGTNNFTLILKEYRSGYYDKFLSMYDSRMKSIQQAQNDDLKWKSACFENAELSLNMLYYPVEVKPNRGAANSNFEKYFGLDEVYFCDDTIRKFSLFLKGLE